MQLHGQPLHIPQGIRFECTGCGNCCLQWPVPATDADVQRIKQLSGDAAFRALPAGDSRMQGFTHTLEKNSGGRCTFLTDSDRCALHIEYGAQAKPAMCRLFPYSFTPTPSGTYLYASFASTGVLNNCGRLLSEQEQEMLAQLAIFEELFPDLDADWSGAQLVDGVSLSWSEYLKIEQELIEQINTKERSTLESLLACSRIVVGHLPHTHNPERMPQVEASPKTVDQLLLKTLDELYFPQDVFAEDSFDFDARLLLSLLVKPPASLTIGGGMSMKALLAEKLAPLPDDCEDLLRRFIYSRIFAKLYFGRSYAHLSLLAGIHHLFFLVALLRIRLKALQQAQQPWGFLELAELLRTLERRLTQVSFCRESCSVLEILLSSPSRPERVRQLCW